MPANASSSHFGQSSPDVKLAIEHNDLADSKAEAISDVGTDATLDIEKVVSEAQKRALRTRLITRKGILLASIPPAAVAGLLIFDWLTGILSRSLGLPLG
jgi:archaellum component FlaD/FlaE